MEKKNKKYYQKNYYKHNNKNKKKSVEKKVTYDSLMTANTITENNKEDNYDRLLILKYIAITIVLFTIIITSFILFRNM